MIEKLKQLWASWKVQISFIGGALVVITAGGTCTYDPNQRSEDAEVVVEEAAEVEVVTEPTSAPATTGETTAVETEVAGSETTETEVDAE